MTLCFARINKTAILRLFFIFIIGASLYSCVEPIHPYTAVAPGPWRGVIFIDPNESVRPDFKDQEGETYDLSESNSTGVLPFIFEVIYTNDTAWHVEIINGEERILVDDISFTRTKSSSNMVIKMNFAEYDSHIEAIVKEDIMQGHYVVRSKDNYRIPFSAYHGKDQRFLVSPNITKPANFDGKWKVTFEPGTDDEYDAIGEFVQDGSRLTGTFLTETGDYRFLEGLASQNKLWMSVFDGAHAFLFHAKQGEDGALQGIFRSGKHYSSAWIAERDSEFTLQHPDSLSKALLKEFSITFPDENGKAVTFPSKKSDHIKILQIMGTWCPNCKDETLFLIDYLDKNSKLPIEITSVAFERYKEEAKALAAIKRYRIKLNVPYPILYGGPSSKSAATEKLPMIDKVISYPTMIFLDKNNKVRKVHTGFSGPATSSFTEFEKEFDGFVKGLLAE